MPEEKITFIRRILNHPKRVNILSYTLLVFTAGIIVVVTIYLYFYTQTLLSNRLNERLISVTSTASKLFDGDELNSLLEMGAEESITTDMYRQTVKKLKEIKNANPDVTFAYIYGKTNDPNTVVFIADADVIALKPELNFNEDEITDEGFPGSEFDVSEIPLIYENVVFEEVVVDEFFYDTIWGRLMTAYAPIVASNSETKAVLAIDVDITDFNRLVKATFVPFGLFVILLLFLLVFLTQTILKMWGARVELVQELDRQKDELLSIVSHQLATPISSTKWYLEMLQDGDVGKLSTEQKKHVKSIQGIAENLTDLVSMILDVSRIQLGRMQVDREPMNLNEFFEEILTVISPKALEKKIQFNVSVPKNLPTAMLDRRLMRMTTENLLSNAVKYTPEKGIVEFTVEQKGNSLHYRVKDTGCGIPKAEQGKMFTKLYRASNVRSIGGNGFGLYVAKGAVEAQDGSIVFTSTEGKGTTFTVQLPIIKPPKQ